MLRKYWRHVAAVCCILGALLTPSPDPFSMMLLTVPLYGLYELGLLLLKILPASKVAGKRDPYSSWGSDDKDAGPADGP